MKIFTLVSNAFATFKAARSHKSFPTAFAARLLMMAVLCLGVGKSWGQTPVPMASQPGLSYTENFADIANWTNDFAAGIGANRWKSYPITSGGTANDGKRTTKSSATFVSSTSGGIQKGTGNLVFLSTGSGTPSEAVAADILLDFTGVNAGTISFNWAAVDNASGTRPTSLRVFWSTDNINFTEITAAQVIDVQSVNSGSITAVALPSNFNNSATARLRFYNHAGTVTGAGNRDKISIDDLTITATAAVTPIFTFGGATLSPFSTLAGTPSAQQSYTISGSNLTVNQTNGISVTAPADFEVSLTNNTFTGINGNTVTLSSNGTGNIVGEPVTVYVRYFPAVSGTTSANIAHSGAGVSPAQNQPVSGTATAYFYSKASGDLTTPGTFNTATDGSGIDATNFTNPNQTFEIRNRAGATITADWTVSGAGSKIVVGTGSDLTIPAGNSITGTIDVAAGRQLILNNTILPTLGSLAAGSTVEYAQSAAVSIKNFTTDAVTYANLKLSGAGIKSFKNATTTVTGNLIYDGTSNGPLTIDAASVATFTTINLGGDLTYLGSVTSPVDANSYTLVTTSTGTQTITGNNNVARFFRITENSAGNNVLLSNIGGTTNVLVGNLTGGGITLTNATSTLTLNGNTLTYFAGNNTTSGAGTITGSPASSIVINKTGATTFGTLNFTVGSRSLNSLTINNTATPSTVTLGTALDIYGTLTVTAGTLALGANNLTLKSTAAGTAMVGNSAGAITGNVTVERYLPNPQRAWHLLSAQAVTGSQTIYDAWQEGGAIVANQGTWITSNLYVASPSNGFDATSGSGSILTHIQNNGSGVAAWDYNLANTNATALSSKQGYMVFVRGDRTCTALNSTITPTVLKATGALTQGPVNVAVSSSGAGNTLVGNPYASPIDMEKILANGVGAPITNLDQSFMVWDPALQGHSSVGGYRAVVRTGINAYNQTPVVLGGTVTNDPTIQFIHSGSAFFMHATTADVSVAFTESTKATTPTTVYNPIVAARGDQQILANLMTVQPGNTESLADGIRVMYNDAYKASTADDIIKMGNFTENLSSYRDGKKLIVERRPMIGAKDTIFLRMTNTGIKDYRFQIGTVDFVQTDVTAYLEDMYKGSRKEIDLSGTINNVDFSVTTDAASANQDRFRIVFAGKSTQPQTSTSIKAIQQGTAIAVAWNASNQYNIRQYELERSTDGVNYTKVNTQLAIGANGSDATYNWIDVNPLIGNNHYRVRSVDVTGAFSISQVATVIISKGNPAITVYPNPIINHTVALQFTDMEKGVYQLRLVNTISQVVFTKTINHSGGTAKQTIILGAGIANGNYRLEIIKPDNTKTTRAILITE